MKIKPFRLERYFARYEFKAPHLLCCSDCETLSVNEILQLDNGAQSDFLSLRLGYTESPGGPELRTQISALYEHVSSDQVLVHCGAEEAIFNFMNVTLDAGDHIVVHSPYYQSLAEVAGSIGARVSQWRGNPKDSWALSLEQLEGLLTPKTKVVVVNFPHNPTGYLPSSEFLAGLSRLADSRGFLVFSDEVYRGLEYEPAMRLPSFADINENSVALGVMSKTYGLAGLRIGWIATRNKKLIEALARFKDYTTICNSAPSEFLATLALKHRESIVERNLNIIRNNIHRLNAFFQRHSEHFEWQAPVAGPIAFPHYRGRSIEGFCSSLVEKTGVLLAPGTLFGEKENYFRIGFGREDMAAGVEKLESFLRNGF